MTTVLVGVNYCRACAPYCESGCNFSLIRSRLLAYYHENHTLRLMCVKWAEEIQAPNRRILLSCVSEKLPNFNKPHLDKVHYTYRWPRSSRWTSRSIGTRWSLGGNVKISNVNLEVLLRCWNTHQSLIYSYINKGCPSKSVNCKLWTRKGRRRTVYFYL